MEPRRIAPANFTYDSLFTFIKKNTTLPGLVNAIEPDDPKRLALLEAIQTGDVNSKLFEDKDCDILLLSLFKHQQISSSDFMTAYMYLMALMEYTQNQPQPTDKPVIAIRRLDNTVSLLKIADGRSLTAIGKEYIQDLKKKANEKPLQPINEAELIQHILSLTPFQQTVIRINIKGLLYDIDNELMETVAHGTGGQTFDKKMIKTILTSPGYDLLHYFKYNVCQDPIENFPAFGRVSGETMLNLHQDNLHFIPLINRHVKSNMDVAHSSTGYYSIAQHDIGHSYWASFLPRKYRDFISKEMIPALLDMIKVVSLTITENDSQTSTLISKINKLTLMGGDPLNDILFYSRVRQQESDEANFMDYLVQLFANNKKLFVKDNEKNMYADLYALYFSFAKKYYGETGEYDDIWSQILANTQTIFVENDNRTTKINALLKLAKHAATNNKPEFIIESGPNNFPWKQWRDFLSTTDDSAHIWKWVMENPDRRDQLATLINENNLMFFHPFLPMNKTMHADLLNLCKKLTPNEKIKKGFSFFSLFTKDDSSSDQKDEKNTARKTK